MEYCKNCKITKPGAPIICPVTNEAHVWDEDVIVVTITPPGYIEDKNETIEQLKRAFCLKLCSSFMVATLKPISWTICNTSLMSPFFTFSKKARTKAFETP